MMRVQKTMMTGNFVLDSRQIEKQGKRPMIYFGDRNNGLSNERYERDVFNTQGRNERPKPRLYVLERCRLSNLTHA